MHAIGVGFCLVMASQGGVHRGKYAWCGVCKIEMVV